MPGASPALSRRRSPGLVVVSTLLAGTAFASTAAAGFCHTLPSSAKPVAMFSDIEGMETFSPDDLRRLSLLLGPLMVVLVMACSAWLWPLLGLSW